MSRNPREFMYTKKEKEHTRATDPAHKNSNTYKMNQYNKKMDEQQRQLRYELKDMQDNPILNIAATVGLPNPNNIYEWRCTISGPVDTPFGGGLFFLKIIFPKDYPMTKPEVCEYLNISRSRFDDLVRDKVLPRGRSSAHRNALIWYKDEIMCAVETE